METVLQSISQHTARIWDNPKQHPQRSHHDNKFRDDHGSHDCVTTWCLSDEIDSKRKMDTTWPATQVGPRPVKSGLGGHEAGLFGVEEGITNPSPPIMKRGRMVMSKCPTFSDFTGIDNDPVSEIVNERTARDCVT